MLLFYVNFVMYMRYKENKSLYMCKDLFSSSIFKREFKSHSNKTSKSQPIYRDISCDLQVWNERYDIIYAESGEYAKRITQRGASYRWWGRGYKKCSGITSNFHWSRQNGYRTCRKISYDDRFRQVLYVCVCVHVYAWAHMHVCVCVCVQICNMCSRREQRQTTLFRRFSAHFALRWKGSLVLFFLFLPSTFLFVQLERVHYARAIKFDSLHLENIVDATNATIYQTKRKICFEKKIIWENTYLGSRVYWRFAL